MPPLQSKMDFINTDFIWLVEALYHLIILIEFIDKMY